MNYPLISEYIEAIKSAEDNFEELTDLRPVYGDDGEPVMTSGNFAVVFKMKDIETGKFYALKCFTKEQEGRAEAYHQIADTLKCVESPYLVSLRYLDKELFVDTEQTAETEFPVLLMDWVEGKTLDKFLRENLDDKYALEMLAYRFSLLAHWLIPQPFAHGDLKPDNILVRENGTLVLVDYDGMYVPAMKGQKARELGAPDFRHPLRTETDFNKHIDDFPLLSILISLIGISTNPKFLEAYGAADRLLFSESDYINIDNSSIIKDLFLIKNDKIKASIIAFVSLCHWNFPILPTVLDKPSKIGRIGSYYFPCVNLLSDLITLPPKHPLSTTQMIEGLIELDELMNANGIDYTVTGSLGLYLHGLTSTSYIPHDIDIIIADNENKHPDLTNQMILDLFVQYSGGQRTEYEYYNGSDLFVFYIGTNKIEINAFVDRDNVFANLDFCSMNISGHNIKVINTLSILKAKYKLHRMKDLKFNNELQTTLNRFLTPELPPEFDYEEFYSRHLICDKIRTFYKSIEKSYILYYSVEASVISVLFEDDVKKKWLPKQIANNCLVSLASSDNKTKIQDTILFGIKDEFTKMIKLDTEKLFNDWLRHDISYMVDSLYYILSEMKIEVYFAEHVENLIKIINERQNQTTSIDDLPF